MVLLLAGKRWNGRMPSRTFNQLCLPESVLSWRGIHSRRCFALENDLSQMIGSADGQRARCWESRLCRHQNGAFSPRRYLRSMDPHTWAVYALLAGPSRTRRAMFYLSLPDDA